MQAGSAAAEPCLGNAGSWGGHAQHGKLGWGLGLLHSAVVLAGHCSAVAAALHSGMSAARSGRLLSRVPHLHGAHVEAA